MKKLFCVNEKRILRKYNLRIFALNLPSIAVSVSLLMIVLIFKPQNEVPEVMYKAIFYGLYCCTAYSFVTVLAGSVISDILIKAHKAHTFIEIADSRMVVSQHTQTVYTEGKFVNYKKLWVIELNEVESVTCIKNHIIINGRARYFNERADRLSYQSTSKGIDFDNWWYNANGGEITNEIEVTDFYTYGPRIAQRISYCVGKIKEREKRHNEYRQKMLAIAAKKHL